MTDKTRQPNNQLFNQLFNLIVVGLVLIVDLLLAVISVANSIIWGLLHTLMYFGFPIAIVNAIWCIVTDNQMPTDVLVIEAIFVCCWWLAIEIQRVWDPIVIENPISHYKFLQNGSVLEPDTDTDTQTSASTSTPHIQKLP